MQSAQAADRQKIAAAEQQVVSLEAGRTRLESRAL
jgi:hypothetical protein